MSVLEAKRFVLADIPCGKLKGIREDGINKFLGVRYAFAERFGFPQAVTRWNGEYDATSYGDCCPQYRQFHDESKKKNPMWYNEFRKGIAFTYSEDCLNLNVYAPVQAGAEREKESAEAEDKLPVILYVHGGGFVKGSSSERQFDGAEYAKRGVILVTLNYRLNVFGFYADDNTANLALYDVISALKWVKTNISALGGDENKITLAGQSAGAMCTQALILNPQIKAQLCGAVMLSGGGLTSGVFAPGSFKKSKRFYKRVAAWLRREGEDARETGYAKLFSAWEETSNGRPVRALLAATPVYDEKLVCKRNFLNLKSRAQLPCIIGVTKDDMKPKRALYKAAEKYSKKSSAPVYTYRFMRDLPGDDNGAWHSSDLWYVFGTLGRCWRPFEKRDYDISSEMISCVCNFAKFQKPYAEEGVWTENTLYIFK